MADPRYISARRVWLARGIAALADIVQIGGFWIFAEGAASPFDAGLDLLIAIIMIALLGWHIAFLPAFIVEGLPFADLAPTWTLAVFIASRGKIAPKPEEGMLLPPPE